MLFFRLMQGAANLGGCKTHVESCKVWFKERYRLALGVVNGGYYLGAAFCSILGSYAYDHFDNFTIPFLLIGVGCCVILILNVIVLPSKEESVLGRRNGNTDGVETGLMHWKEKEARNSTASSVVTPNMLKAKCERKLSLITRVDVGNPINADEEKESIHWKEREAFSVPTTLSLDLSMVKGREDSLLSLKTSIDQGNTTKSCKEAKIKCASFASMEVDPSMMKGVHDSTVSLITPIGKRCEAKSYEEAEVFSPSFASSDVDHSQKKGVHDSTVSLITRMDPEYSTNSEKADVVMSVHTDDDKDIDRLTPVAVGAPVVATFFLDAMYGYTVAIAAPYLMEVFQISVAQAGFYIMTLNLAMSFGSIFSGFLMQKNLLSSSRIIGLSAVMGIVGMWFLFPGPAVPLVHNSVPYTAFLMLFLIGCSDQMGSMASFKAIEDVQVQVYGRTFGSTNRSYASSIFYTTVTFAMAAGSAVTVVVLDALDFEQGSWIVIGGLVVTLVISVCLDIALKISLRRRKTCSGMPVVV